MKHFLALLILVSPWVNSNCSRQAVDTATCDVNKDYVTDGNQASQLIVGEWKLVRVTAMIPNPPVENLRLTFTAGGDVTTIRNDQPAGTHRYEISPVANGLQLKTNAEPQADNWFLRNPAVRICADELFLDGGIALDGPGYLFRRVR